MRNMIGRNGHNQHLSHY